MKTPSISARSALEGRLQFQVLQQVLYHTANVTEISLTKTESFFCLFLFVF